jgi:iron(III) transport system permease protein
MTAHQVLGESIGANVFAAKPRLFQCPGLPATILLIPSAAIVGLLLFTLWISLRTSVTGGGFTLANYAALLSDSFALTALANTLVFAAVAVLVALVFGLLLAWIVERTDFSAGSFVYSTLTLGVLIPGFFTSMAWLFLLHPRSGILNRLLMQDFDLSTAPLNIVSPVGMGIVQGIGIAPIVFVVAAGALRAMDTALEEAAQASGANFFAALREVTLPLLRPAILGAALYVFVIGLSAFDVPAVIGLSNRIFTFSTFLAIRSNPPEGLPQYGVAGAFSAFMIAAAIFMTWGYTRTLAQARNYQVISGKGYRPRRLALKLGGKSAAWAFILLYISAAQLLPLLVLAWTALIPYLQPPSLEAVRQISLANFGILPWPLIRRGIAHTVILALLVPTIGLSTSCLFSWVVLRSRSKTRFVFDGIAFLPHAVPSIVFGVAALIATLYLSVGPIDLYGSIVTLVLVLAITQISFGTRITNAALIQVGAEIEEAAQVAGAHGIVILRQILLPLLKPALLYAWLWLAMLAVRELTVCTILSSQDNLTLSVVIYTLLNAGSTGQASAVALLLIAGILPLVAIYLRFAGHRQGAI